MQYLSKKRHYVIPKQTKDAQQEPFQEFQQDQLTIFELFICNYQQKVLSLHKQQLSGGSLSCTFI